MNIINDVNRLSIEVIKAIILQYFKLTKVFSYDTLAIINIPNIGINSKDKSNITKCIYINKRTTPEHR